MGQDIRAGAAFVELFLKKGAFDKSLTDATKQLKAFGDSLTNIGKKMLGVGAAISAPLALAVQQFSSMGDAVNKASQRTGIAVETLSALKYAAEQSGLSFEELEGGIRKMNKALFEAQEDPKGGAAAAFAAIKLSAKELQALSPEERLLAVAEALSKIEDTGTRGTIAMEIMGKGAAQMLPFIENGAAGIRELTRRAEQLGIVIGKDDAEAATKFGDTLDDLHKQIKAVVFAVGAAVANALQPFADGAIRVMTTVIRWVQANKNLVVGLLLGAVAFVAAGASLLAFGLAIKAVILVGSALAATLSFIGGAIAFLLNPIVLVSAAIIGLAIYFGYASGIIGETITWLGKKFDQLKDTAGIAFSGIADALAAGDIQLAAQILWVGLQTAWAQGTHELMEKWINFKYGFVQVAVAAFYGILEIYQNVKAGLITAWTNTVAIFGDIWDGFTSGFMNTWDEITSSVAKGLLYVQSLFDGSDYEANVKAADDQLAANKAERDDAAQKSIAARAEQLSADLAEVEKERDDAVARLDDEAQGIIGGANDAAAEEIADLNKKEADLKAQLAALRAKAAAEKKKAEEDKGPPLVDPAKFNTDDIFNNRKAIESPAKSNGLFNIAALQSLQSTATDDAIKQTAKNTAEIAKNTKNTAKFK